MLPTVLLETPRAGRYASLIDWSWKMDGPAPRLTYGPVIGCAIAAAGTANRLAASSAGRSFMWGISFVCFIPRRGAGWARGSPAAEVTASRFQGAKRGGYG